jgi:hypothetical protein
MGNCERHNLLLARDSSEICVEVCTSLSGIITARRLLVELSCKVALSSCLPRLISTIDVPISAVKLPVQ